MFAEEKENLVHLYVAFGLKILTLLLLFALNLAAGCLYNRRILSFPEIFEISNKFSPRFLSRLDLMPLRSPGGGVNRKDQDQAGQR